MKRAQAALIFVGALFALMPVAASALISQSQAQPPGACEKSCRMTNYANLCAPGGTLRGGSVDAQCAQSRLGIPTYTPELTTYGNTNGCRDASSNYNASGREACSSGSCTTYQGQNVLGIAHRTFPMGTRMEVCNMRNQICAIATVVDRGPAENLQRRTIDAYSVLSAALRMNCGTVPATYKVLSAPGISGTAEPSGPTEAGIEAILEAQRNGNGMGPGMNYQAGMTPWGYGYIGTPPPIGSAAYGSLGTGYPTQNGSGMTQQGNQQSGYTYYDSSGRPINDPSTAGGKPGEPSLNLVVWPETVARRGSVTVIWTSVNMAKDSCQVLFDGQEWVKANEGSKLFTTVTSDATALKFTLKCQDSAGQYKEVSDSATIQ